MVATPLCTMVLMAGEFEVCVAPERTTPGLGRQYRVDSLENTDDSIWFLDL
jgi:hypothetical protein